MALFLEDIVEARLDDDDLVARYHVGDQGALDVLLHRYRAFARAKARTYFLVGADSDDIEQEGMIGLYKAVRDYRPDREAGFRAFAELCITRQVISAIKGANRAKHQPMNRYVSISGAGRGGDDHDAELDGLLEDHHVADPADDVCQRERVADMQATMRDVLSGLEVDVLGLFVEGRSYQEIGSSLNRQVKAIDNALQRIKRKVEHHMAERDAAERSAEASLC